MTRIRALAVSLVLAGAGLLSAASPALAAPARVTPPTASYQLFNGDNWFSIQVANNPSNYSMQAELKCVYSGGQLDYRYGGWVNSSGAISTATSACESQGGQTEAGYFRFRKPPNSIRVTCWLPGNSRTGFC